MEDVNSLRIKKRDVMLLLSLVDVCCYFIVLLKYNYLVYSFVDFC